jgi:hypothetical protein
MAEADADELVTFRNVRVVRTTGSALFCTIGSKSVWLQRGQIRSKLRFKGDRGTLRIRRSVALDRELLSVPQTEHPFPPCDSPRSPEREAEDVHPPGGNGEAPRGDQG